MLELNLKHLRLAAVSILSFLIVGVAALPAVPAPPPPRCADVVASSMTASAPVDGSLKCLGGLLAAQADSMGITTDEQLMQAVSRGSGSVRYLGQSSDGGYVYEETINGRSLTYVVTVENGLVVDVK